VRHTRRPSRAWPRPELTVAQILAWADAFHALTGSWPTRHSGPIRSSQVETWSAVNTALQCGNRGLPGGSSLPRLLAEHRGVRNRKGLPRLTPAAVLRWADAHYVATGTWPRHDTEPRQIPGSGGETWLGVDSALRAGTRGLPGGSSLARLLAARRRVRNRAALPPLTVPQILAWADGFRARTGGWPRQRHWREPIPEAPGETWGNVMQAVALGLRGLPAGRTLFDLLAEHRGARNVGNLPALSELRILLWADAYRAAHGARPTCRCPDQVIPGSGGERWFNVDQALRKGLRGLPGGSSLAQLLSGHRR
jgi:hypothetical protein